VEVGRSEQKAVNVIQKEQLWGRVPWWGFAFLAAGWIFILAPICTGGFVPGINGDSRFNLYVLEHFYRWMAGTERGLLDAGFFHPYPLTLGFSDPHTFTGILYAGLRFAGWKSTEALCAWFALGNVLNYVSTYWVLRKFGLRDLGAGVGAFVFVFSLPCTAQFSHIQMAWRCAVPPSIFFLQRYLETRRPLLLGCCALLLSIQTAMSFYVGFFLLLLMAGWAIGWMAWQIRQDHAHPITLLRHSVPLFRTPGEFILLLILAAAAAIVLLWGVWPNLEASRLYGFKRGWGEIAAGLPRLPGYLQDFYSYIWWRDRSTPPNLPMWWEQNLFPGIVILAACFGAFLPERWNQRETVSIAKWAILFLFLLTISVGGSALYLLFTKLPGFSAVRSVSRIIVIMMFPTALATGAWIESLAADGRRMAAKAAGFVLIWLLLLEASMILHARIPVGQWEGRLSLLRDAAKQELHGADPAGKVLVVLQSEDDALKWDAFEREIDAMLIAQEFGIPALNGYSGNLPTGWKRMCTTDDILANLDEARRFRAEHGLSQIPIHVEDLVVIGEGAVDRKRLAICLEAMFPGMAVPDAKN